MIAYLSKTDPKKIRGVALVRLDFNTKDDWRMRAVLPTLKLLLKASEKIVIVSHYGRPDPLRDPLRTKLTAKEKSFSLWKDAATLGGLLKKKIVFLPHFDFAKIKKEIAAAPQGTVFLLENLRFLPGEEKNDPKLAKALASLADFYVNDAFAVSHRADASVVAVTRFLPSYAGLELEREIAALTKAMERPSRPFVFIAGGAKASDKLGVIAYFKNKADYFLTGGGTANTVLLLRGFDIKKSLADKDPKDLARLAPIAGFAKTLAPDDFAWRADRILDIGPHTALRYANIIAGAKTIVWSGPLGMIERKPYDKSSIVVAQAIAKNREAFSLTGGGETVAFLKKNKLDRAFSFISTGGGAMLDFLAGEKLPGIEALKSGKR